MIITIIRMWQISSAVELFFCEMSSFLTWLIEITGNIH